MTPTCCSMPQKQGTLCTSCCGFGKTQSRCAIGQRQSMCRAASKCASYSEGARLVLATSRECVCVQSSLAESEYLGAWAVVRSKDSHLEATPSYGVRQGLPIC